MKTCDRCGENGVGDSVSNAFMIYTIFEGSFSADLCRFCYRELKSILSAFIKKINYDQRERERQKFRIIDILTGFDSPATKRFGAITEEIIEGLKKEERETLYAAEVHFTKVPRPKASPAKRTRQFPKSKGSKGSK